MTSGAGLLADFLWLSSSAWTAIGTVSIAIVTIFYVIETRRIADRSTASAAAAERSAQAVERSAEATETAAAEERERRQREAEAARVRLMRGFLAEVSENLELGEATGVPFHLPFVREMWAVAKDRVGDLPEEVAENVRRAYALAAKADRLAEWHVLLSSRGAVMAQNVEVAETQAVKAAREAFAVAASVLDQWITMKEEAEDIEQREGPSL